jgi:hypothetical protein
MALHFRCPHCKIGSHRCRAVHMDRKAFEDASHEITPHTEPCPITRQLVTYGREEMFWKPDE